MQRELLQFSQMGTTTSAYQHPNSAVLSLYAFFLTHHWPDHVLLQLLNNCEVSADSMLFTK